MEKKDFIEKFQSYCIDVMKGYVTDDVFSLFEKNEIKRIISSLMFIQKYEMMNSICSDQEIKDAFLNNLFYFRSCLKGSHSYLSFLNKYPKLNKLNDNKLYESTRFSNEFNYSIDYFLKKGPILESISSLVKREDRRICSGVIKSISLYELNEFKNFAKNNQECKFYDYGFTIPSKYFVDNSEDDLLFIIQDGIGYMCLSSETKFRENFFSNGEIKIFENGKERLLNKNDDLQDYFKKLRDGLVHYGLKVFATDFGQFIYVIKMNENNDYFCCSESWFNNFSITTFRDEVDRLKFFFIPKHDEIIKTSDECLDILKKGMILEIKIDKKIPRQAFCDYVLDLFTLFRDSVDIKKDIVDFLVDKLSDFYSTEVICYKEPEIDLIFRRIINNEDMYFFGTNNKNSKNKMIRNQNHFLERIINSLYQNLLVDNYSNSEMLCSLSRSSLLFYMNLLLGKLSETEFTSYSPAGEEIEIMAVYCHILIYMRLVYNQFFDKLKNINLDDVSVDYFKTEPGKLRLKLNELDMSYVEIIDINNKNNSHKVKSLSDKIFALRIIRNSISHNGFRYKITKTSSFADIVLNLSSLSNPNLVVRLEAVDLMVLLNEDLFKENTKVVENDDTTVSFIEIENYLKKIK